MLRAAATGVALAALAWPLAALAQLSPGQVQRIQQQQQRQIMHQHIMQQHILQQHILQQHILQQQRMGGQGANAPPAPYHPPVDVANRSRAYQVVVLGYDRGWAEESRRDGLQREEGTLFEKQVHSPKTMQDAENEAMQACREGRQARDCHVLARVVNACVAIAEGRHVLALDEHIYRYYVSPQSPQEQAVLDRGGALEPTPQDKQRHIDAALAMCEQDRIARADPPSCHVRDYCVYDSIVWSSHRLAQ
ncbi:hypothetical protein CK623_04050 [Vandammella animalimorsus]|uniref:Uncharacterized protein n=2 Tax=Vandammella animalimorsus TaxID=2029117 RepID=A0A2A2AQS8_9BURK|nr:hypothetical protein CK623_04050 [Vandammella animalimorsus]